MRFFEEQEWGEYECWTDFAGVSNLMRALYEYC